MKKYSNQGVTGILFHDTRKIKQNEKYPVKYRVTYGRNRHYYLSGIDLSINEFSTLEISKKRCHVQILEKLLTFEKKIDNHIDTILREGVFSFEALNKRMGKSITNDISSVYDRRIKEFNDLDQIGTSDWYRYSYKSISTFSEGKKLNFSDITIDFLLKYEKWMLKDGKSYTTISMHLRALQAVVNEGKEQGYLTKDQYPFGQGKYEIPSGNGRKLALTLSQIGQIMNYIPKNKTEEQFRDFWFFAYLCNGINTVDMLNLKYWNISNKEISFYRIKTIRKSKVKKKITATLLPQMEVIIDKWGNPDRKPDNFIFPFLTHGISSIEQRRIVNNFTSLLNKKMGIIGKELGFGKIGNYVARHSYATVLKRSGANIAFISESLGHTELSTTENYLDSFEQEERMKNASLLTNFKILKNEV